MKKFSFDENNFSNKKNLFNFEKINYNSIFIGLIILIKTSKILFKYFKKKN
jgi:hypothetical protein